MNNLSPLVTIVTPTFNQAEFIVDTVESVLNQTYQYIEYLVIDDGSTDVTPELMRCYDKKLSYIQQENMGQAATLNRGWHLSAGQIIGYLSSDDCLKPTAVEELVKALLDSPDAILVYPDFDLIDASGNVFRQVQTEEFSIDRLEIDLVCQPGPGALFKKEIFNEIGGWNESLRQVPDFEYWLRASQKGQFKRVAKSLAYYRVHEDSGAFRPVPIDRSNEIIKVTKFHWKASQKKRTGKQKALSNAHLIAAKSHLQSGRLWTGLVSWITALKLQPTKIINIKTWRLILSGLLRRQIHRIFRNA
jgi:glycosyltransferase involved in cell wall biosynthesis